MTTIEPRTAVVTIYTGDYLDRIRHIERKFEAAVAAEKQTSPTLDDASEAHELAAEHRRLSAEADECAIQVTVTALGRRKWREIVAEHPPRPENKSDAGVGVNEDTFKDALVPASIVEPALTPDDLDSLSDADYDRIYVTAFALNRVPATSPKALVWPENQTNDEISN